MHYVDNADKVLWSNDIDTMIRITLIYKPTRILVTNVNPA